MKLSLIFLCLVAPSLGHARTVIIQPSDCVKEYLTPLSEKTSSVGACRMTAPLRLTVSDHDYPNLSMNPRRVEVWEGSYSRDVVTTTRTLRELVDTCHGRIISRTVRSENETRTDVFSVRNPNLDDAISESFMTVPMTNVEAATEMRETLRRCEQN